MSLIQHFEADFLWKVSLKILNSGIILKTFTHGYLAEMLSVISYNSLVEKKENQNTKVIIGQIQIRPNKKNLVFQVTGLKI